MPYYRRRRYYRKRTTKKRPTYVRKVARQEARKAVKSTAETKTFDTSVTAQALDYTTGYVGNITNGISQGSGEQQYIGDKITPVGIALRTQFTRSDSTQLIRVIILQNKAGGVPVLSTLLQSVSNITAPLSPYDIDYNDTYRVLFDTVISMDSIRGTTLQRTIKIPRRKLRVIKFNSNVGGLEKGGIYACFISDSAAATHPTVDYRCRFYFKDL